MKRLWIGCVMLVALAASGWFTAADAHWRPRVVINIGRPLYYGGHYSYGYPAYYGGYYSYPTHYTSYHVGYPVVGYPVVSYYGGGYYGGCGW